MESVSQLWKKLFWCFILTSLTFFSVCSAQSSSWSSSWEALSLSQSSTSTSDNSWSDGLESEVSRSESNVPSSGPSESLSTPSVSDESSFSLSESVESITTSFSSFLSSSESESWIVSSSEASYNSSESASSISLIFTAASYSSSESVGSITTSFISSLSSFESVSSVLPSSDASYSSSESLPSTSQSLTASYSSSEIVDPITTSFMSSSSSSESVSSISQSFTVLYSSSESEESNPASFSSFLSSSESEPSIVSSSEASYSLFESASSVSPSTTASYSSILSSISSEATPNSWLESESSISDGATYSTKSMSISSYSTYTDVSSISEIAAIPYSSNGSASSILDSAFGGDIICETSTFTFSTEIPQAYATSCQTTIRSILMSSCDMASASSVCETYPESSFSTDCQVHIQTLLTSSCAPISLSTCETSTESALSTSCATKTESSLVSSCEFESDSFGSISSSCETYTEPSYSMECAVYTQSTLISNCEPVSSSCELVTALSTSCETNIELSSVSTCEFEIDSSGSVSSSCEVYSEPSYSTGCEIYTQVSANCEPISSNCETITNSMSVTTCETSTESSLVTNCYPQSEDVNSCEILTESALETFCDSSPIEASISEMLDYSVVCVTSTYSDGPSVSDSLSMSDWSANYHSMDSSLSSTGDWLSMFSSSTSLSMAESSSSRIIANDVSSFPEQSMGYSISSSIMHSSVSTSELESVMSTSSESSIDILSLSTYGIATFGSISENSFTSTSEALIEDQSTPYSSSSSFSELSSSATSTSDTPMSDSSSTSASVSDVTVSVSISSSIMPSSVSTSELESVMSTSSESSVDILSLSTYGIATFGSISENSFTSTSEALIEDQSTPYSSSSSFSELSSSATSTSDTPMSDSSSTSASVSDVTVSVSSSTFLSATLPELSVNESSFMSASAYNSSLSGISSSASASGTSVSGSSLTSTSSYGMTLSGSPTSPSVSSTSFGEGSASASTSISSGNESSSTSASSYDFSASGSPMSASVAGASFGEGSISVSASGTSESESSSSSASSYDTLMSRSPSVSASSISVNESSSSLPSSYDMSVNRSSIFASASDTSVSANLTASLSSTSMGNWSPSAVSMSENSSPLAPTSDLLPMHDDLFSTDTESSLAVYSSDEQLCETNTHTYLKSADYLTTCDTYTQTSMISSCNAVPGSSLSTVCETHTESSLVTGSCEIHARSSLASNCHSESVASNCQTYTQSILQTSCNTISSNEVVSFSVVCSTSTIHEESISSGSVPPTESWSYSTYSIASETSSSTVSIIGSMSSVDASLSESQSSLSLSESQSFSSLSESESSLSFAELESSSLGTSQINGANSSPSAPTQSSASSEGVFLSQTTSSLNTPVASTSASMGESVFCETSTYTHITASDFVSCETYTQSMLASDCNEDPLDSVSSSDTVSLEVVASSCETYTDSWLETMCETSTEYAEVPTCNQQTSTSCETYSELYLTTVCNVLSIEATQSEVYEYSVTCNYASTSIETTASESTTIAQTTPDTTMEQTTIVQNAAKAAIDSGDKCNPTAWSDSKLFPFGESQGDINIRNNSGIDPWWWLYGWNCFKVQVLREGFPFFDTRHFHLYICDNGLVQFDTRWKLFYPFSFSPRRDIYHWLNRYSLVAPFWGLADASLMNSATEECRHTKVFYQVYQKFDSGNKASVVLDRISSDIRNSNNLPQDFQATWSMVITWVNLAPYVHYYCRYYYMQYMQTYMEGNSYYQSRVSECLNRMESAPLNHFQLVLATDGTYSFAKFIYPENGINWAHPDLSYSIYKQYSSYYTNINYLSVAGYSAPMKDLNTNFYSRLINTYGYNLEKVSGEWRMESVDSINGNTGKVGEWILRLENSTGEEEALVKCMEWVYSKNQTDKARYADYLNYSVSNPCPCSIWQVWWDGGFIWSLSSWYSFEDRYCYESRFSTPLTDTVQGETVYLRQKCCYDTDWRTGYPILVGEPRGGNLIVSDTDTSMFSWWQWWERFFRDNKIDNETEGFEKCCRSSFRECPRFYELRLPTTCIGYRPPLRRRPLGDPHFLSLDGFNYTFNGLGEFVLLNLNDSQLQVQVRTVKAGESATQFSSVAVLESGKVPIQVNLVNGSENELELYINGMYEYIGNYTNETSSHSLLPGTLLSRPTNASFQIDLNIGVTIEVAADGGMITPAVTVSQSFENMTEGLLGVMNGDISDDLTPFNGTAIPLSSSEKTIFNDFGMTWQTTNTSSPKQSIFHYTGNTNYYSFIDVDFVPMFTDNITFTNATLEALAREACGDNVECLFDVASTGDLSVGKLTKNQGSDEEKTRSNMENFPPSINGPSTVLLYLNQLYQFKVNASDQNGDAITFSVSNNISHIANVTATGNGEALVSVLTKSQDEFDLKVIVKDSKNAAEQLWPEVTLCACKNEGNCTENEKSSAGRFQIMSCDCAEGYTGSYCESDLDACAENSEACYQGVTCLDLPPPANISGYECGPCPNGYTGDGKTCSDIDECADASTNSCEQLCLNTPGSVACVCNVGYSLADNGVDCTDDDECVPSSDCSQNCNNTIGSYVCYCDSGFTLNEDGKNCAPSNPCTENIGCDLVNGWCYVDAGQSKCGCKSGYQLGSDSKACQDTDECSTGKHRCTGTCVNSAGSYTCHCGSGYSLGSDGYTCEDVDECYEGTDNCLESQKCTNVPGSFNCSCPDGQVLKDELCIELSIDEKTATSSNRIPTQVETENAISFTVESMAVSEYTVRLDNNVKTTLAEKATEHCSSTSCTSETVPSAGQKRRKRSTPTYTFTIVNIERTQGYPQVSNNDSSNIILSFYLLPPTSDGSVVVLSSNDTLDVITNGISGLMVALGNKTISNIQAYVAPPIEITTDLENSTNFTNSTTPSTTQGIPAAESQIEPWVYGVAGGGGGLLLIIIIVGFVVYRHKKKKGSAKIGSVIDMDEQDDETFQTNRARHHSNRDHVGRPVWGPDTQHHNYYCEDCSQHVCHGCGRPTYGAAPGPIRAKPRGVPQRTSPNRQDPFDRYSTNQDPVPDRTSPSRRDPFERPNKNQNRGAAANAPEAWDEDESFSIPPPYSAHSTAWPREKKRSYHGAAAVNAWEQMTIKPKY